MGSDDRDSKKDISSTKCDTTTGRKCTCSLVGGYVRGEGPATVGMWPNVKNHLTRCRGKVGKWYKLCCKTGHRGSKTSWYITWVPENTSFWAWDFLIFCLGREKGALFRTDTSGHAFSGWVLWEEKTGWDDDYFSMSKFLSLEPLHIGILFYNNWTKKNSNSSFCQLHCSEFHQWLIYFNRRY